MAACLILGLIALGLPPFLPKPCKSFQSEARVNLESLRTSERVFFGEYGFYTTDLVSLNWQPDGSPHYLYGFATPGPGMTKADLVKAGFDAAEIAQYDESRSDTARADRLGGGYSTAKMHDHTGRAFDARDLAPATTAGRDSFLAGAVGDVDRDDTLDVWTIDQARDIEVVSNDCVR